MASIKVVINGVTGKMGVETLAAVSVESDLELVGGACRRDRGPTLGTPFSTVIPLSTDLDSLLEQTRPDVLVDFTNAAVAMEAAAKAAARKINIVMGASGFSEDQLKQLDAM
ncbi:MAG: 4-hydroxy-tetrahydrodipicolinate reductase, partial [Chloroflexi bacterium]|nr:4-hydroxy-tetrahydrodipicolinate reductase [Chloroflexota bacterium]